MHTAIRLKKKIDSSTLKLEFPELEKLKGREVEIIIMIEGKIEDDTKPPKAVQNSTHVAGSFILDEEAIQTLLNHRFK